MFNVGWISPACSSGFWPALFLCLAQRWVFAAVGCLLLLAEVDPRMCKKKKSDGSLRLNSTTAFYRTAILLQLFYVTHGHISKYKHLPGPGTSLQSRTNLTLHSTHTHAHAHLKANIYRDYAGLSMVKVVFHHQDVKLCFLSHDTVWRKTISPNIILRSECR